MLVNPVGKFRVSKDVHQENAEFPMLFTPSGKFRAAKDVQ